MFFIFYKLLLDRYDYSQLWSINTSKADSQKKKKKNTSKAVPGIVNSLVIGRYVLLIKLLFQNLYTNNEILLQISRKR